MTIYSLVSNRNFTEAAALLKEDSKAFENLKNYERNNVVQHCLREKAFDVVEILLNNNVFNLDLFELDRWSGSFIDAVFVYLPLVINPSGFGSNKSVVADMTGIDEESLIFFSKVCSRIENIDEPLEGKTMLDYAISKNIPIPALQVIVDSGCPANRMDASENTLLFKKLQAPIVEWLIGLGLDVNHKNKGQKTPLQNAIDTDQLEVARILMDNGADASVTNKEGNSLFYTALVDKVSYTMFDLLCEYNYPDMTAMNNSGSSLLFNYIDRTCSWDSTELEYLDKLMNMGGDVHQENKTVYGIQKTPLELSFEKGFEVFERLLEHNSSDINQADDNGNTILHKVCAIELNFDQNKAKDLYKAVKLLLHQGADASLRNTQDKSAMDLAIDDNLKEKAVKLLLIGN